MKKAKIKDSKYFKEIKEIPLLTKEEEYSLFVRLKNGDEQARKKLIESNLRLVANIALKYISYRNELEFEDLINEGILGLISAVDNFDATKGYKFSTYATYYINQKILMLVKEHFYPCLKRGELSHVIRYNKAVSILEKELQRIPTDKEIANYLKVKLEKVLEVKKMLKFAKMASLEHSINEEDDSPLNDFIQDKSITPIIDYVEKRVIENGVSQFYQNSNM